jgi:hypothetical protein
MVRLKPDTTTSGGTTSGAMFVDSGFSRPVVAGYAAPSVKSSAITTATTNTTFVVSGFSRTWL